MSHEVELKFDVEPGGVALVLASPMLPPPGAPAQQHDTVYFDTKHGLLRDAGFSLRVRRTGGRHVQTVKRKRGSAAGFFIRQEWESEVPGFEVDRGALKSAALKRLLEKAGGDALVPLVRTLFRRTMWEIDHRGSRIEVVLDEGKVTSGAAEAPLCELELELKSGKPASLFALAAEIAGTAPLRLGVLTKSERGHALAEGRLGRAAKAEPVQLGAALSQADAFRAVAHACLRHYRLNEIVLLADPDAEALHQARIALRRLRSAFSLFRATLRGKDYGRLREELRWLAGQFGDARNLDVMLAGQPGRGEPDELLRIKLARARAKAYGRVAAALRSERTRALMLRLALWIETGVWRFRERALGALAPLAEHQLDRQWRKVRRHGARLGKLDAEARHRLRIDIKKLRYAAEFLAGLHARKPLAGRRDRFISALKDLQERLGDLGDAEAAQAMAARFAPGLHGSAAEIERAALAGDRIAAAKEALGRASSVAGYWLESDGLRSGSSRPG